MSSNTNPIGKGKKRKRNPNDEKENQQGGQATSVPTWMSLPATTAKLPSFPTSSKPLSSTMTTGMSGPTLDQTSFSTTEMSARTLDQTENIFFNALQSSVPTDAIRHIFHGPNHASPRVHHELLTHEKYTFKELQRHPVLGWKLPGSWDDKPFRHGWMDFRRKTHDNWSKGHSNSNIAVAYREYAQQQQQLSFGTITTPSRQQQLSLLTPTRKRQLEYPEPPLPIDPPAVLGPAMWTSSPRRPHGSETDAQINHIMASSPLVRSLPPHHQAGAAFVMQLNDQKMEEQRLSEQRITQWAHFMGVEQRLSEQRITQWAHVMGVEQRLSAQRSSCIDRSFDYLRQLSSAFGQHPTSTNENDSFNQHYHTNADANNPFGAGNWTGHRYTNANSNNPFGGNNSLGQHHPFNSNNPFSGNISLGQHHSTNSNYPFGGNNSFRQHHSTNSNYPFGGDNSLGQNRSTNSNNPFGEVTSLGQQHPTNSKHPTNSNYLFGQHPNSS